MLLKVDTSGAAGDLQIASFLDSIAKMLVAKGFCLDACNQYRFGRISASAPSPPRCLSR